MKKYISLEHAIRKAVAEQNYKKKALDESISPVDYDKPKEVPQAFFKPVHIQPRQGSDQIAASGPTRARRNVEKEKSSETMHPELKKEEKVDEAAAIAIPIAKGLQALVGAGAAYFAGKQTLQSGAGPAAGLGLNALSKTNQYIQDLKTSVLKKPESTKKEVSTTQTLPPPAQVSREAEKPAAEPAVPASPAVPSVTAPTTVSREIDDASKPKTQQIPGAAVPTAAAKPEVKPQETSVNIPASVASATLAGVSTTTQTKAAEKTSAISKAAEKTATAPNKAEKNINLPSSGTVNTSEPFYVSGKTPLPKRLVHAKLRKEETRYDIKNVARPEDKREEEIVGRPKSKYKLSKQTEIIRKIIEDKKIIIKNKEEKMGKNPLVNTEPELKHNQLDQGS